jgi:outer membrane immunogenic protein
MKKTACLAALFLAFPASSYAADDMLAAAMKRIAELEASNKAKDVEINKLKAKPSTHVVKAEPRVVTKKVVVTRDQTTQGAAVSSISTQTEPSLAGLYGGINGGYGGGDVSGTGDSYAVDLNNNRLVFGGYGRNYATNRYGGALAGGQIGYNFITPSHILYGGEIDIDWADISNNSNSQFGLFFPSSGVSSSQGGRDGLRWLGTARARLGYQIGSVTPFISGGLAFGEASSYTRFYQNQSGGIFWTGTVADASGSKTSVGWAAGAGVEYAVAKNISLKTEYLYTQIGSAFPKGTATTAAAFPNSPIFMSTQFPGGFTNPLGFHQVRFGINYHLHLDDAPSVVAAKY